MTVQPPFNIELRDIHEKALRAIKGCREQVQSYQWLRLAYETTMMYTFYTMVNTERPFTLYVLFFLKW